MQRLDFTPVGAIFDVDDTLLDNKPGVPGSGLHERSRIRAVHTVGERHGISELANLSVEDNLNAFLTAPVHSLPGAVWNILCMSGLADGQAINPEHPLLKEIVDLKNELHKDILLEEGNELPGASSYVRALAEQGLQDKLAIASTAVRRDIDLFLGKYQLDSLFPPRRIVSYESITHPKPHPEAFDLAFVSLGLADDQRSKVLAFEDDPRGVMAAKAAGLFVMGITSRFSRDELSKAAIAPDIIADSYAEFAEICGLSPAD